MTAGGPVDPTMPLPEGERRGAPQPPAAEPTGTGPLPGAYDPTVAVPPVGPPDDPYGPPPGGDDEEPDNRKWLWGILAALGVILLGVVIALLVSGGGDDGNKTAATTTTSAPASTTTSTSTPTTTSSTTTTPTTTPATTAPNAPVISAFTANPNPFQCDSVNDSGQLTLTWSTQNATGVTISIDGPGIFGSYGPNGQQQVPFAGCNSAHTYTLTAKGSGNQQTQQTITVQPKLPPSTTTTTEP